MVRCLSYWNSMSDIVYKSKNKVFSSDKNVQYYCFQSAEIKESGADLVMTFTSSTILKSNEKLKLYLVVTHFRGNLISRK